MGIYLTLVILGVFVPSSKSLLPFTYSQIAPSVYHYPDLTNCHKFYHFDEIILKPKSCGLYLMFNPIRQVCDWPERVAQIRPECQQKPVIKYPYNPERAYPKSRFRKNRKISENFKSSFLSKQRHEDNTADTLKAVRPVSEKLPIINSRLEKGRSYQEKSAFYETSNEVSNSIDNKLNKSASSEITKDGSYSYEVVLGKSNLDNTLLKKESSSEKSPSIEISQENESSKNKPHKKLSVSGAKMENKDKFRSVEDTETIESNVKRVDNNNVESKTLNKPTKLDIESISRLVSKTIKEQILLALKPALLLRKNNPVPDVRNLSREDKLNLNKLTDKIVMTTKNFKIQTAVPDKTMVDTVIPKSPVPNKTRKETIIPQTTVQNKTRKETFLLSKSVPNKTRKKTIIPQTAVPNKTKKETIISQDDNDVRKQRKIYIKTFPYNKDQLNCQERKCVRKKVFKRVSKKFINEEREKLRARRMHLAASKQQSKESGGNKIFKELTNVSQNAFDGKGKKAITLKDAFERRLSKTNSNKSERPLAGHLLLEMMVNDFGRRSNEVSILEDIKGV